MATCTFKCSPASRWASWSATSGRTPAATLKPLGDGFIKLIRMMIAPIIFGTVVVGIAKMGDMKSVGRIGVKALLYFEVVSTIALVIGLVVINLFQPGVGHQRRPEPRSTPRRWRPTRPPRST